MKLNVRHWPAKRLVIGAVALSLVLVLAVVVTVPLAVSSGVVRDRLERDIGAWAGHSVSLGDAPSLDFWPTPTIQLDNVVINPATFSGGDPILRADSIVANFNLFSAIAGAPSFTDFQLIRPTFNVELYPDGTSNWSSANGQLSQGIAAALARHNARQAGEPVPADAVIPDSAALGTVTITDGALRWIRDPGAAAERLTAINGTLAWTVPTAPARANITAIFRGEQFTVEGTTSAPLLLLGKQMSPLDIRLSSSPLSMDFSGSASLGTDLFASGSLRLASASVRRALEWSGAEIKPGEALGALELTAELSVEPTRARLDDLIVLIDANRGIGVLDLSLREDEPPLVSGTLAFSRLDIASFLQAFTPLPQGGDDIASTIDTRFLRELGLDLRLSAQSASFGPVIMSNLAAAARVDQGRANFDVGDATAYGGNLIGRIVLSEQGVDGGLDVQLSTRDTNLGSLFDAVGLTGPLPRGSGSLDIKVTSPYPTWATALTDLTGQLSLNLSSGVLPGIDVARFRELSASERFFDLEQLGQSGSFAFNSARFEAAIAAGEADLKTAELIGPLQTLSLSGVIPYTRSSLAIAGVLGPTRDQQGDPVAGAPEEPVRFFIGGSWPQPVISPVRP